jgi:hypothetical protein
MYSTCLFCQQALGSNETLPTFPVGRRLAFDPERGRLWVVCLHCARWNLTPLEERWEAIEEAERRFRDTRRRAGTGEISLARLAEGTELVRIGRPARLEMAAWRYGDQFGRRRARNLLIGGALATGGAIALGGALAAGVGVLTAYQLAAMGYKAAKYGAPWHTVARVRTANGGVLRVRSADLRATWLGTTEDGLLNVRIHEQSAGGLADLRKHRIHTYVGVDAERVLGQLLPSVNRLGGTRDDVERALRRLDAADSPAGFFEMLAAREGRNNPFRSGRTAERARLRLEYHEVDPDVSGLFALPVSLRLAMEMAAHEEREQQAMQGDLVELELAWQEAEEVAQIADGLLLPPEIEERFGRLKGAVAQKASHGG